MNSFVFVHLMGGMGNQMFQYAAGLLQKKLTNGKLYLEKAVENPHDTSDYRDLLFTEGEKYDTTLPYHLTLYQENGFVAWNPNDYKYPVLLLFGYFQNYRTLSPILPEFRNHILEKLSEQRKYMSNKYSTTRSGFIHVRRGDYVTLKWELDSLQYYKKAMNMLDVKTWYILSDDIEWCKTQFSDNCIIVEETNPVLVMALMSLITDAAIISNSTFSWMGAYLGCGLKPNSVIYPYCWIKTGTPDLFPKEWMGI